MAISKRVDAVKIGAAINKTNRQRLGEMKDHAQGIIDHASAMLPASADEPAGVNPDQPWTESKSYSDAVIAFGDAVKAVDVGDGNIKLGGYLIRFGNPDDTDLTGDYFTKDTDFGDAEKADGWLNHRLPIKYKGKSVSYKAKLPKVELTRDDVGILAEMIIGARNDYEKMLAEMGVAGKLGWSSGTAPHLCEYKSHPNGAREITAWPLGLDASLTPQNAEPTNTVIPLKSLMGLGDNELSTAEVETPTGTPEAVKSAALEGGDSSAATISTKESTMEITKDELQQMLKEQADAAVKAYQMAQPAKDTVGTTASVEVTLDEADRPFRTLAEQAQAVKNIALDPRAQLHPRLKGIKAIELEGIKAVHGNSENIPSDGGFLLEPTIGQELLMPLHTEGPFSNDVRKLPVSSNSNYGWINGVDETSRATGSRWGGVQGYRLNEGGTITASKPKFRRINWELKKYAVLLYATDEQLLDSTQFNEIARTSAGEELAFMVNDDIVNGLGAGGPQGILISGATISVTRIDATKVQHQDVVNMWKSVLPKSKAKANWYINPEVQPQLDQLYFTGTTSVLSPYVGYQPDGVMTLYGRPVKQTEFNSGLGVLGDIIVCDPSEYLFWEKGDVQAATSIHIAFLTDEQAFRFIYRCDGQTSHYSKITPYKTNLTSYYSSFVALSAST